MNRIQQSLEVLQRAVARIDILIIRYIIAIVHIRGPVNGIQPQHIHTQGLDVIQLLHNSPQIPDSIPVGIAEALGINLIHHCFLPPFFHIQVLLPILFCMVA